MDLNTVWFLLVGVLFAGYAILDGFDLGVGALSLFARDDNEQRIHINAIGPVWDGNEVWLLTGGGALFAAFPPVYATVFSSFYIALMLLLAALIFRAVSMEFRGKVDCPVWRRLFDWMFGIGSLLPALLLGVALGNILRGIPLNETYTFTGSFLGLLNPYAILIGLLTLSLFIMHGAIYMAIKTVGDLQSRMQGWANGAWMTSVILYVLATISTFFAAPFLFDGILSKWSFWVVFLPMLGAIAYLPVTIKAARYGIAFLASSVMIAGTLGLTGVSLYPRMVPSLTNLDYSLTVYAHSSTPLTLKVMLVIALIGMPMVIAYTAVIYYIFRGKTEITEESY